MAIRREKQGFFFSLMTMGNDDILQNKKEKNKGKKQKKEAWRTLESLKH